MMKGLTLLAPWAGLIAYGSKRTENRTWYTNYRGPLLIHAGKGQDESRWPWSRWEALRRGRHPRGQILAVAELVGVDRRMETEWDADGQFHWRLAHVRAFHDPISCSGKQGLWVPDEHVIRQINLQRCA